MLTLRRFLRAIFILPFSAGHPRNYQNSGFISHDGSISGLVFLVGIVVILCETLVICSDGTYSLFTTTMTVTTCLAIFICVSLSVYASIQPEVTVRKEDWDISHKIMLRFLWLFTLASMTYSVIYLAYHIDCFRGYFDLLNVRERIVCDCLLFIFRFVQTGFLTQFSRRSFVNNLGSYYGLLILFLANISVIVIEFVHELQDIRDYSVNSTTNSSLICLTNSTTVHVMQSVESYMDPTVLEYSLLAILFVSELWPKRSNDKRKYSCVYDSMNTEESTRLILSESNEHMNRQMSINCVPNEPRDRTLAFIVVASAVLINTPCIILFALRIYGPGNPSVDKTLNIYNSTEVTVLLFVLFRCFYLIQTDCMPTEKIYKYVSKDYMILVSFVGSLVYYTMRLIAYAKLFHDDNTNGVKLFSYVIMIFAVYLQTVFIFQMKSYERIRSPISNCMSIEYACLFMSMNNLIIWGTDSFLASSIVFATDAPTLLYGKQVWVTCYFLLFPIVMFYRFKCFVAFYGLYHKLVKRNA
ncbi:unnamed protein product [Mytilus edulis]|uniref:Uncharacterized protein n=1 Tax=Mytilus edulis TaxID=6550 RepID=A0A8S3SKZ7_MYTED|nr:unnamed protein product [Mytilus edulis]